MRLDRDIAKLFDNGNRTASVFDVVADWDCEFNFSIEEIKIWYRVNFYVFLYGRTRVSSYINADFFPNWKETSTYQIGLNKIYRKLKKYSQTRVICKPVWIDRVKKYKDYFYLEDIETEFRQSKIYINGKTYPVKLPMNTKGARYRPKPGFNPVFNARKCPYKYTIAKRTYVFGWSRSKNFIDLTKVLMGIADYPVEVKYIVYDLNIDVNILGAYPFLAYLVKNKLKYGSYERYINFISKRIVT